MTVRAHLAPRAAAVWLVVLAALVGCSGSAPAAPTAGPLVATPVAPLVTTGTGATPGTAGGKTPDAVPVVATKTPIDPDTTPTATSPAKTTPPAATPAPTPTASPTPTPTVPDTGPAVPAGMSKEVLGFFLPGQMDYVLQTTDFSVLSSVAFFGITANKHGSLHTTSHGTSPDWRWTAWTGSKMTQIINKAHAAGTKVFLTVTRFAWTSNTYNTSVQMLSQASNRERLAEQTAQAVVDRGVDGVNVDFEPIPASQKANFVDFVRRLRTQLDSHHHGLEMTVDSTGFIGNYDVAGLTAPGAADAIFIMAYHYTGTWSKRAGSVSPLHRSSYDVTDTVNAFLRYTTPDKIMLGLPYYGNTWATQTGDLLAWTRPGSSSYGFPGSVVYSHAVGIAADHGRLWDSIEDVPWVRWQARACSSCPLSWHELYYEDAQSLHLKHALVLNKNLRGTGVWTLGFGGRGHELNDELRSTFGSH